MLRVYPVMLRVYVEDFNTPVWAVDTGEGTAARRFEFVISEAAGYFRHNPTADNILNPKAFVEYPDGILKVVGNTAIIRDHRQTREDFFILR